MKGDNQKMAKEIKREVVKASETKAEAEKATKN